MCFRRYFSSVLFALVLWQTTSIADAKQRKLDEPSEIFRRYQRPVETFLDSYVDFRWLDELNLFTDDGVFQETEDGKVVCECLENPSRRNQRYECERGFGKDEDCWWVIYQRARKSGEKMGNCEASKKCFPPMQELASEMYYWKKKAVNCLIFMKMKADMIDHCWQMKDEIRNRKESEYKKYLAIVAAVIFLVFSGLVYYVCENNDLRKSLKEAITERERLREKLLSERERFHNIQETN